MAFATIFYRTVETWQQLLWFLVMTSKMADNTIACKGYLRPFPLSSEFWFFFKFSDWSSQYSNIRLALSSHISLSSGLIHLNWPIEKSNHLTNRFLKVFEIEIWKRHLLFVSTYCIQLFSTLMLTTILHGSHYKELQPPWHNQRPGTWPASH